MNEIPFSLTNSLSNIAKIINITFIVDLILALDNSCSANHLVYGSTTTKKYLPAIGH